MADSRGSTAASEYLFVYGTLAPGQGNHYLLENLRGDWQPATAIGYMDALGWGVCEGYPGFIEHDSGGRVDGWLLQSADLASAWQMLDRFEGSCYERCPVSVVTRKGENILAHTYLVAGEGQRQAIVMQLLGNANQP